MSLINNMLSDLDARRQDRGPGSAFALDGLQPVRTPRARPEPTSAIRLILLAALIGSVAACSVWYGLRFLESYLSPPPRAGAPQDASAPQATGTSVPPQAPSRLFELPVAPDSFAHPATSGVEDDGGAPDLSWIGERVGYAAEDPGRLQSDGVLEPDEGESFADVRLVVDQDPHDAENDDASVAALILPTEPAPAKVETAATVEYAGTMHKQPRTRDEDPAAQLRAALELSRFGRSDEALVTLARLIDEHPAFAAGYEAYAAELLRRGERGTAERVLRAAVKSDPGAERGALMLAHLVVDQGRIDEALDILGRAAPGIGEDPEYHAFIAALQQRAGRHDAAISSYQGVLQHVPHRGVWWMGLAISLAAENQPGAAQRAFERALGDRGLSDNLRRYATRELNRLSGSS